MLPMGIQLLQFAAEQTGVKFGFCVRNLVKPSSFKMVSTPAAVLHKQADWNGTTA